MTFPHHLFKAYDIRGVVETDLTADLVERIGRALGAEARRRGAGEFVIGRDGRVTGAALADALARGILASGCDVIDIGLAPTPVLYFATTDDFSGGGTGVQVTASHNPAPDNGLKMMIAGNTLFGEAIQAVKRRVIECDFSGGDGGGGDGGVGKLRRREALAAYRQKIADDIRLARPLKVVVDCGNGVAGVVAPQVFRAIGCEVVELFCEVDGAFPNHHPDPGDPKNLQDLIVAVQQHDADFGMAFDGDGDRLGVVSSDGGIIWPDRLMLLFTERILAEQPGAEIIYDVKCSQILPRAIGAGGGVATMCKTGHSFIKDKLKQTGAALAGEMSGHIFFNDRWGGFDDAIYAGARLCELLADDHRAPSEVFAALPDTVNTPELRLDMAEGEHHALVAELASASEARFSDAVISDIDGIRVDFDYGFGLIRASNTTPAIIMRFEAGTQAQLETIQERFRELLQSTGRDLRLPF